MPAVQCFGGPLHGRTVSVKSHRFEVTDDLLRVPISFHPLHEPVQRIHTATYSIRDYGQGACHPHRHDLQAQRHISVAVMEGAGLSRREEHEVQQHAQGIPWEWPKPSILHDFDEWWRWTLYHEHRKFCPEAKAMDRYGPWFDT